ncbi:efflux RND transporter periplasmic adaptor subunit, partial [bacterium]
SCGGKGKSSSKKRRAVPVKAAKVVRRDISRVLELTGNIDPWQQVEVTPNISGKVAKIYVDAGDTVKQGEILAKLDTEATELQLEQAEAGLAIAKSNLKDAELNWKRMQNLKAKGSVSEQQYEKVQLAYNAASAQLKQAQAALDLARYQLDVSIMKAPFAGVIASRNLNEGEMINPMMMMQGSKGVVTLMDISKIKIKASVSDRDEKFIRAGLPVYIRVDAHPDSLFRGRVYTVSPAANLMTRTFEIEIEVANPEQLLKPGMFARLEVIAEKKEGATVIPFDALIEKGGNRYVYVVDGSIVHKRAVATGLRERDLIEIVKGLKPGEAVVTFGKENLEEGSSIVTDGGERG